MMKNCQLACIAACEDILGIITNTLHSNEHDDLTNQIDTEGDMIVPVVIKQCIASLMDAKVWVTICVLGMVAGQRVKEDMVDMLVGQLAKEVEAENAEMAVSELVEIFRKVKNGRKSLTEEIWRMLKKLKGK